MSFRDVAFGLPDQFNVLIEIYKGATLKYEYDPVSDMLILDYMLSDGLAFPHAYGFVPQTTAGDKDPLDVFVVSSGFFVPGTVVPCRAIGMVELLDRGEEDNKLVAVSVLDPVYKSTQTIKELGGDTDKQLTSFLLELGRQKKKTMEIIGFHGSDKARVELEKAHKIWMKEIQGV